MRIGGGQQSYNLAQNFAESTLDSANCAKLPLDSALSSQIPQILRFFYKLPKPLKFIAYFAFLILSFIAGMASEQMGILTIIALICLNCVLFLRRRNCARFCDKEANKNVTKPLIFLNFALLFFITGYLALYLSPGHAKRASLAVFEGVYMSLGQILALDFSALIRRIAQTIMAFRSDILFFFSVPLLFLLCVREVSAKRVLIFALLIVLILVLNNNLKFGSIKVFWLVHISAIFIALLALSVKQTRAESRKFYLGLFALFVAFCLCMLSTIQFPSLPHRARLGDSMIIIAMVAILFRRFAGLWVQILAVVICAVYALFVAFAFLEYRISWEKMLASIEQSKRNGEKNIVVDNIFHSRYKNLMGWGNPGSNPNEWPNPTCAQYFGVESFRVK